VERYEYDVYGACRVHTDDGADDIWLTGDDTIGSSSAKDNPYLFTGRRLDILDINGSLKIQYNRNRYYDPRFNFLAPRHAAPPIHHHLLEPNGPQATPRLLANSQTPNRQIQTPNSPSLFLPPSLV